jgi:hypothetical protein
MSLNLKRQTLQHKFTELMPDNIEDNILYVSLEYGTAIHKCACGCGNEVVTPITPTDWQITFDGETVSLSPSIGNWEFNCRSHYWIRHNKIYYARPWTEEEVASGRENDVKRKKNFFSVKRKRRKSKK